MKILNIVLSLGIGFFLTLEHSQAATVAKLSNEAAGTCTEFPSVRKAMGHVDIFKVIVRQTGQGYQYESARVCSMDTEVDVIDTRLPGECFRGTWVDCEVDAGGKPFKAVVALEVSLKHYVDQYGLDRSGKVFGAGLFVDPVSSNSSARFQDPVRHNFMTPDLSLSEGVFQLVPAGLCANPDSSPSCRSEFFEAMVSLNDR